MNYIYSSNISKVLACSFAYLKLFREINNETLQIPSYNTSEVQHNETIAKVNF